MPIAALILGALLFTLIQFGQTLLMWVLELVGDLLLPPFNLLDFFPNHKEIIGAITLISYILFAIYSLIQWIELGKQEEPNISGYFFNLFFGLILVFAIPVVLSKVVIPFNYYSLKLFQYVTSKDIFEGITNTFANTGNTYDATNTEVAIKQVLILFVSLFIFFKLVYIGGKRIAAIVLFYFVSPIAASSIVKDSRPFMGLMTELVVWLTSGSFIFICLYYGVLLLTKGVNIGTGTVESFSFVVAIALLDMATKSDDFIRPFIYKQMGSSNASSGDGSSFSNSAKDVSTSSVQFLNSIY